MVNTNREHRVQHSGELSRGLREPKIMAFFSIYIWIKIATSGLQKRLSSEAIHLQTDLCYGLGRFAIAETYLGRIE